MTLNQMNLMFYSRELQQVRLEEAERQRNIRAAILANPTWERKIWLILRDRWQGLWNRNRKREREQKLYAPITRVPGNLHNA